RALRSALDLNVGPLTLELCDGVAAKLVEGGKEPRPLVGGKGREQERAALSTRLVDHRMQPRALGSRTEAPMTSPRAPFALDQPLVDQPLDRAAGLAVVPGERMDEIGPVDRRVDADLGEDERLEGRQSGQPLEGQRSAAAEVRTQRHQR